MSTYCVDIDGTICQKSENDDYDKSFPIEERIKKINQLYDEGHIIKYFTARGMGRYDDDEYLALKSFYGLTRTQLESWGCKYHQLILGKPSADYYIDDKAIKDNDFFN